MDIPQLHLAPAAHAEGTFRLPGSKSISNRVLLLAALGKEATLVKDLLDADDVRYLREALVKLGVDLRASGERDWQVAGCGGSFPVRQASLFLGNAGTAVRPLTAVLAMLGGDYTLDGVARMRERPIGDLVEALRLLHCKVSYQINDGFLPLTIGERERDATLPARVAIRGDVSSQFLSALLMALPLLPAGTQSFTEVTLLTPLISRPYVAITTHLMQRFGVAVETPDAQSFKVPRGARYISPGEFVVESDASSASYFLAAGVLGGGPVRVVGVGRHSIQGDVKFASVLQQQGGAITWGDDYIEACRGQTFTGGEIDCLEIPDAAMTLAITALTAAQPTTLRNIGSWRVKETDRIAAMETELRKVGVQVESGPDWLKIYPQKQLRHVPIDTYDDHRMAMCFSLLNLLGTEVTINHPECVAKTFPKYFEAYGRITEDRLQIEE